MLALYHAALLLPRERRPLPLNYLLWAALGLAVWLLVSESWNWTWIPALTLTLIDTLVTVFTLKTLDTGRPGRGFWQGLGGFLRLLTALAAFGLALGALGLMWAFGRDLPRATGPYPVTTRLWTLPAEDGEPPLALRFWLPGEEGEGLPQPWFSRGAGRPWWDQGLTSFDRGWQTLPVRLPPGQPWTVVVFWSGPGPGAEEYSLLLERWARWGFVVAAPLAPEPPPPLPPGKIFEAPAEEWLPLALERAYEAWEGWRRGPRARLELDPAVVARRLREFLPISELGDLVAAEDWVWVSAGYDEGGAAQTPPEGFGSWMALGQQARTGHRPTWSVSAAPGAGPGWVFPDLKPGDLSDQALLRPLWAASGWLNPLAGTRLETVAEASVAWLRRTARRSPLSLPAPPWGALSQD